jgi:hypothetical protein
MIRKTIGHLRVTVRVFALDIPILAEDHCIIGKTASFVESSARRRLSKLVVTRFG